jgi:hypothetical protein
MDGYCRSRSRAPFLVARNRSMSASTVDQADQYRRGVVPAVLPTDIQNGVDDWPF